MAHQKQFLKELLKEDQEPFYLKDYIADKQCLLKKQTPKTPPPQQQQQQQIQLKKPKPMSRNTSIFSKNTCFFSLQDSPDLRRSPLFAASPVSKKSPNRVFLHVPAKTASVLLEAAMRIQKQSKPNNKIKNSDSFGLFGSMLKRLTLRNRTHKLKTNDDKKATEYTTNASDGLLCSEEEKVVTVSSCSSSSSSSCCTNEGSSSLDFESSISGRSFEDDNDEDDDEFEFTNVLKENNNNNGDYAALCLSPLNPFRSAHHKSPSPPPKSPARRKFEDIINYGQESPAKCQSEEDEEDKEQNSPVSVLDPPFEDDYDGHDDYDYDQGCSYAFVQKAKQQLLHKLHRFEKLAELDPVELEKRMIEDEEELGLEQGDDIDKYDYQSFTFSEQRQVSGLLDDVLIKSGSRDIKKPGIKRLISDLIIEEQQRVEDEIDNDQLVKRVCKRLDSWREVECNTIDMMVEMDLRSEIVDWRKPQRCEISETVTEIEVVIFAALVNELAEDLAFSC